MPAGQPADRPMPPGQLPRLVSHDGPLGLRAHFERYGQLPAGLVPGHPGPAGGRGGHDGAQQLIAGVERAGLTGRGGAGFPTARKMRAVAAAAGRAGAPGRGGQSRAGSGRGPGRGGRGPAVVIANGVESEPASGKDAMLLSQSPHLVLDGIAAAVAAVGASEAYLCVEDGHPQRAGQLSAAIADRARAGIDEVQAQLVAFPGGYVASEESALVNFLNGGRAVPVYVPPRPFERGVSGRATLINNVETLAHIALIARYGPDWFSAIGTQAAPGSTLLTISGAVRRPGVYEVALGTRLGDLISLAGGAAEPPQAILSGGYFGGWLPWPAAVDVPVSHPGLRSAGAALGAGVLIVLPGSACGVGETARVFRYLAGQSAGQCGPCRHGLPAIADALDHIAWHGGDERADAWLRRLLPLVEGRGACHFPDGAVALAASALRVFCADLEHHLRYGPCQRVSRAPVLPVPQPAARPQDRGPGIRQS
jgi:NADH:ubiquinone oxidoreductase subunit F (NADH-binding)